MPSLYTSFIRLLTFSMAAVVVATTVPAAMGSPHLEDSAAAAPATLEARQFGGGGFTTQYWANQFADLDWKSGSAGQFAVDWDNGFGGNFVVGKGYRPGGPMLFNYTGTFDITSGRAYLALYGWTTNPLVEYYVVESMGVHNPSDNANATCFGTLETDGGTYEVWMKWRINAPSIIGDADFMQIWSIRTRRHVGGTINTANHFAAWAKVGLLLGRQNYMVIGVEGQQGRGAADITAAVPPPTRVPESATPTTRTERPMRTNTCTAKIQI
ncbi:endo-beta-xylanase [Apiospora kogelbergensis]|uniref:endo-beta-xylanase n=1 Tax=Apiospora kogelbergensis TaxID=1337665 RepID=UPI00312E9315